MCRWRADVHEVITVLGPVAASELGYVDAHEHLFLRTPALAGDEFWDPSRSTAEAAAVRESGITTVVDLTPVGLGRRPAALAKLSVDADVHVVAATGYHRSAHYPAWHWAREVSEDDLLDILLTDLTVGMDDRDWAGPRPGRHRSGRASSSLEPRINASRATRTGGSAPAPRLPGVPESRSRCTARTARWVTTSWTGSTSPPIG
jgi:hypothetical protein